MSIKAIHIFFICASIVISVFFGAWSLIVGKQQIFGILSFAVTAGLIVYANRFIKKMKGIS